MPWDVFEENGQHCVYKLDADGNKTGNSLKCYGDLAEAQSYVDALYANTDGKAASRGIEYKAMPSLGQQISDRTVTGIAAVIGNVDDGNDRLWQGAFTKTLKENKSRVRHLWNHNADEPPTAAIRDLREISKSELPQDLLMHFPEAKGGLLVSREYLDTPRGSEVLAGIRAGAINEMSFGYKAVRKDYENQVRNLREVALLDTSDVPWGMNPASRAVKGALQFKASGVASKDSKWDASAELKAASLDDMKMMCAWVDLQNVEDKSAYKLPHHRADDGHSVVWQGVVAAMAALLGSKGGVDIPEGDRRAVYDHLAKHYAQFNEEPPDYKLFMLHDSIKEATRLVNVLTAERSGETKVGRMISSANMSKIQAAIEALQAIMNAAEPLNPEKAQEKALTVRSMFAELELLEVQMEQQRLGAKHA